MSGEVELTPMMAQYRRIKSEVPREALLLFRLGDFYEMFFEDAQIGAQLLNVALTRRGAVPMCGIPYHAAGAYLARLLKAGRKVAICEQVEDARPGQLVKREVTQILSPGTHFDERMLTAERPNYLAAVCPLTPVYGLACVDMTTGEFRTTQLNSQAALATELKRLQPAEILCPEENQQLRDYLQADFSSVSGCEDWIFAPEHAQFTLRDHFKVAALDGFGLRDRPAAIGAAGAVLHYLAQHLRRDIKHLTRLACYECSDFLVMDATTLRNLEILEPLRRDAPGSASLYSALNRTITPMGARRLRQWLSQPLAALQPILSRQKAIAVWVASPTALEQFRQCLKDVRDLERIAARLSVGSGNARDLAALAAGLRQIPKLRQIVNTLEVPVSDAQEDALRESLFDEQPVSSLEPKPPTIIEELAASLRPSPDIVDLMARALVDEPPAGLKEGGMIRDGFEPALDELRRASREGKDWIARLQAEEIERTGIASLKVRFNSVFGYYIEITRSNLDKVPPEYIRKQTIANAERFITPALKEMEGKILGAEERSLKLEHDIFLRLREAVIGQLVEIQETAGAIAQIDVLASFAETARLCNYCCPAVGAAGVVCIEQGRHPVLDQALSEERFVPNDVHLDLTQQQIALITGPNMAGKSTFIRQVALLALLAHTGSYVPAAKARIDLIDRIFTRIGASDDLARGQSTFMVEMSETANILNNATRNSLIILDEIGRGTSTFDGLSLAWSMVEFLHNQIGAKTLFATHYHELTELAARLPRLGNFNVAVREWNDQIIFLRKILPGGTDKSYGIQVARLAGVPREILTRAKEILSNLEASELTPEGKVRRPGRSRAEREKLQKLSPPPQLDLFADA
jgi:DNA mismatch repair protein MutS